MPSIPKNAMLSPTKVQDEASVQDSNVAANGILSPELARFFDAMASHFPGHVMQRVMRLDGSVYYTYVSPGLASLGLDRQEILAAATSPQDWIHPEDRLRWRAALAASAAVLSTLDEEVRVLGNDGRLRWVRSIGNPRRLPSGEVVWDGIALDVTEKREAVEALRLAKTQADAAEAQKAHLIEQLQKELQQPMQYLRVLLSQEHHDANMSRSGQLAGDALRSLERASHLLLGRDADAKVQAPDPRIAALTRKQREVLALLGEGLSNEAIAKRLGITTGTVKLHVSHLLRSLGFANRSQAATFSVTTGQQKRLHRVFE